AAVGDKNLIPSTTQYRLSAQPDQHRSSHLPSELGHLNRYRHMAAEPIDQLLLVDNDDEPVARGRDDLFAQQGAAEAFDQVEAAAHHFIGAVDRQIDALMLCKSGERNAEASRLRGGALGSWDADDLQS